MNDLLGLLDHPVIAVVAALAALTVVLAAFTAVAGGGDAETTFVKPATPSSYIFMWAIEQGHVALPPDTAIDSIGSLDRTTQLVASGQADIGMVPLAALPNLVERNPDLRVLPYKIAAPTDFIGIYTRTDANITAPADLAGKRIALSRSSTTGAMTLAALEDGYNITPDDVTVVDASMTSAPTLLSSGDVDAAFVFGYPPASEMRPVLHPYSYFEEETGGYPLTGIFVADGDSVEGGIAAVQALQQSGRVGAANASRVISTYQEKTGRNISTLVTRFAEQDGDLIAPLTPDNVAASQTVLDYAVRLNITQRNIDMSSLIAN